MTPLWGTKNPSAPVGDKSGEGRRAARSLLSCTLCRVMGRLWRGMGGRRPQRRQHGLLGFTSHATCFSPALRRLQGEQPQARPTGFHESRDTSHETRLFIESRPSCRVGRQVMRDGGQARRIRGEMYEARENEWKGVFLNPETGITTYTESGFGSRFGIPHYSSVFVGKIRISPCRQSSAPEHCGNRDIGFMDVSSRRITSLGPQVSPSGGVKGERATNRETRPLTRREAQAGPGSKVFTKHKTRNTKHGFFSKHGFDGRSGRHGSGRVASRKTAARSLLSCAWWRGIGRLWRGMGGMERPEPLSAHRQHRQQGHSGFHETRDPRHGVSWARGASQREFPGFHETRNTRHETRPFFETRLLPPCGSTWVRNVRTTNSRHPDRCSCHAITVFMFTSVRHCSLKNISRSQCSITVRRFRSASRRAPFAAAPVSLRVAFAAAIARWTHAEKGQCTGSHQRGKLSLLR